ncbi:MAG: diacylglycerol kinase family protein [Verrucomicrobiota bacterium]
MRICVIFNPAARGQKAQRLKNLLDGFMRDCVCKPTSFAGEARALAAEAVGEGFDTVVAAGGDGTLNEVINGIGDVSHGFTTARLGVLPLGTMNVFARELKIPLRLEPAWKAILQGHEMIVDLPIAEFDCEGKTVSRYFAQLAGAGLDSKAVELVNWELKKKIGPLAYVAAGIEALRSQQSLITVSSSVGSCSGELALIGNGKLYGGNFVFFPKANLCDGQLEVCVFPKVNWQILCRAGIGFMTKSLHRLCGAKEFQSNSVILTADRKTFLQLDGENVGELPAKFSIRPKILRVIVP